MPLKADLADKVLLPVLGDQFGKVLEDQQLVLVFENGGFLCTISNSQLSHRPAVLGDDPGPARGRAGAAVGDGSSATARISQHPDRYQPSPSAEPRPIRKRSTCGGAKKRSSSEGSRSCRRPRPRSSAFIAENVEKFNGTRGEARSFDLLDDLLLDQSYRLAYWRVAADEINYRRFFDVNDLAAIRMENPRSLQRPTA